MGINHIIFNTMIDWTEKYRPKSLRDIIGNKKSVLMLKKWADQWKLEGPEKKAVILSGKPGIGKTSCAYALAHQYHWIPIELNTSDTRNKETIKAIATSGSQHQTFTNDGEYISAKDGGRKLIILDEADNLYERASNASTTQGNMSDKGGKQAIIDTIKTTKQPIILIVNDYYNLIKGRGEILKKICTHLVFYPPRPFEIASLLQNICHNEGINIDPYVLQSLSSQSDGDIRSVVHDLQSISIGKKKISRDDILSLGVRDRQQLIFDVLNLIFTTKNIQEIKKEMINVDEDPNMLIQWINENIANSYENEDLYNSYEYISKADLFLARTYRRNNYSMWSYASNLMGIGVSLSKNQIIRSKRYHYPTFLRKRRKLLTSEERSIIEKIASFHHCSIIKAQQTMLPLYKKITDKKTSLDYFLMNQLKLTDEEMVYFYGSKFKQKIKKDNKEQKEKIKEKEPINKQQTLFPSF